MTNPDYQSGKELYSRFTQINLPSPEKQKEAEADEKIKLEGEEFIDFAKKALNGLLER